MIYDRRDINQLLKGLPNNVNLAYPLNLSAEIFTSNHIFWTLQPKVTGPLYMSVYVISTSVTISVVERQ